MIAAEYLMAASGSSDRDFFLKLGERIRALRKAQGMTQVQLAERLGYSQQQIVAYEKGRRRMYASVLPKLADILGVSLDELLGAEKTSKKRGPASKLERQLQKLSNLPRAKQRFVSEMLDTVLQQAS